MDRVFTIVDFCCAAYCPEALRVSLSPSVSPDKQWGEIGGEVQGEGRLQSGYAGRQLR